MTSFPASATLEGVCDLTDAQLKAFADNVRQAFDASVSATVNIVEVISTCVSDGAGRDLMEKVEKEKENATKTKRSIQRASVEIIYEVVVPVTQTTVLNVQKVQTIVEQGIQDFEDETNISVTESVVTTKAPTLAPVTPGPTPTQPFPAPTAAPVAPTSAPTLSPTSAVSINFSIFHCIKIETTLRTI